jgi:ATP-binding cassette subfamily B multidrug efflux pump
MKSLFRFYRFLQPYRYKALTSLLLLIAMVGADLLIPHLTQRVIDQGIAAGNLQVVISTALIMIGAALLSAMFAIANNAISVSVAMAFGADVRSAMMRKVQSFSFGNLDALRTGNLIVRSTSDVRMVQMIVLLSLRILTRAPIWAVGAIILLIVTSPRLALIMSVFIPVIIVLVWVFARYTRPLFMVVQQRLDRLNVVLQENLAGVRVVKAFVRMDHEQQRFAEANEALTQHTFHVARYLAFFNPTMMLVLNLAVVVAVWFGGVTAIEGTMSVGEVVAAVNYLSFALFPILMLTGMIGPISAADASASRIMEILDAEPAISTGQPLAQDLPQNWRLAFHNVGFSYAGNGAEATLADISFVVEPGQTVAIVGATGCGKSTLVHLIPRFYEVSSGCITVDDIDIRMLEVSTLRQAIGIALQEAVLFTGTVRDNIRYGRMSASDEEVREIARVAQADSFITALPQGYDTLVGPRGVTLSGGQRQRIAIARALLVQPCILILDDATSALDIETEARLQEALDKQIQEAKRVMTRIVVAQRISTVIHADTIIVLEQGRVVAVGSHQKLLQASRVYRDIYRSQLGGAELPEELRHG